MWKERNLIFVGLVVLLMTVPASAVTSVLWDGSGIPSAVGYELTGAYAMWTFDSDDGTPGSAPGYMYQHPYGTPNPIKTDAHWDMFTGVPDLDDAEGWFVEEKFQVITDQRAIDDSFGIYNELRSSGGLYWTRMTTDGIVIGFTTLDVAYPGPGPYHTLRYQKNPGDALPTVILDGVSQGQIAYTGGATSERTFEFGDGSITGDGIVVWDYVVINTEIPTFLLGDANGDHLVSADDYASVQAHFADSGAPGIPGDANHDGLVSADDYASVQAHFGDSMPEPATLGLLAIGLVAVFCRRSK